MFDDKATYSELSEIAEQAKKRAEVARYLKISESKYLNISFVDNIILFAEVARYLRLLHIH